MANMAQPSSSDDYLEIPGYKFWIEIVGKKAKHYQVHEDNNVVSCFIASEANQEFRIFSQKHQDGNDARAKFYINDDIVDTHLFKPKPKNEDNTYQLSRIKTEKGKQKFAFASIDIADDEHADFSDVPNDLGTIRIDMYRVKDIRRVPGSVSKTFDLRDVSTISEKSKSIGFQTISLQPPETPTTDHSNGFVYAFDYVDSSSSRSPWYTIKFFYRTLDILRAQGITSASSSSSQSDADNSKTNQSPASVSQVIASTPPRKLLSTPKVSTPQSNRTDKSRMTKTTEAIVVEDSNPENDKPLLNSRLLQVKTEQSESSKRSREPCGIQTTRQKRAKKSSSPAVIVIDSD